MKFKQIFLYLSFDTQKKKMKKHKSKIIKLKTLYPHFIKVEFKSRFLYR